MPLNDFRIHSIALCKNEADVIGACLREASTWSDFIYVYDGDSEDDTWPIVLDLAKENPKIIPWKQDGKVFQESLRAEVFNAFQHNNRPGDWWFHLNVDEFYIDDPRDFLSRISLRHHVVWGLFIQYMLTDQDINRINFDQPFEIVRAQLRFYISNHSEIRCFRYRTGMVWDLDQGWPYHLGLVHPDLIRFKHYPYRSPIQIQTRLDVRRDHRARGFSGWAHASQADWKDKIVPASLCQIDRGDGQYRIEWDKLTLHRGPLWRRGVQHVMHGLGLWP